MKRSLSENLPSLLLERVLERITKVIEVEVWKPENSIVAAKITKNLSPENLESVEWPYCDDSIRAAITIGFMCCFDGL